MKDVKGHDINSLMYARQYDSDLKQFKDITVQEFENDTLMRVEKADYADWNGSKWVMHEGRIYDVSVAETVTRTMTFKNQELPITQKPSKVSASQKKPDEMTIRELREQISLLDQNAVNTNKMKVEMYNRFAMPLASLGSCLVGAALACRNSAILSIGFSIPVSSSYSFYYTIATLGNAL